ncbi:MAG: membrane protein YdbS with pleckstrin-like domain [Clostridium sp.]|jgi:membrane protein YdbS with pleckstrin-like domain
MEENKLKKQVLKAIPYIGTFFCLVLLISVLFAIWGSNFIIYMQIASTSIIIIFVLHIIEKTLE